MNKFFSTALEEGHLEPVRLPSGAELELPDAQGNLIRYYFASADHVNLYAGRLMQITDISRMHTDLKLNPDYLRTHNEAMADLLQSAMMLVPTDPGKAMSALADLRSLQTQFEERTRLGMEFEHFYDLVAAMLFTESEDPRGLDVEHNAWKKRHILSFPHLHDFFLSQRLSRFVPWQVLFDAPILNLNRENTLNELITWDVLQRKYNLSGFAPATLSSIGSRMETLSVLTGFLHDESRSTMSS